MKEIILNALNELSAKIKRNNPTKKKKHYEVDISDVELDKIYSFVKENNIPSHACFELGGDDMYAGNCFPALCYSVEVETTDEDKDRYYVGHFRRNCLPSLVKALKENGYILIKNKVRILTNFSNEILLSYERNDIDNIITLLNKFYEINKI